MKKYFMMKCAATVMAAAGVLSCSETSPEEIKVESMSLDPEEFTMNLGSQEQLKLTVYPVGASYDAVIWTSSEESVVTVSGEGLVSAVGIGEASVTARIGNRMAQSRISVMKPEVTGVTLDREEAEIYIDESVTLVATVTPDNVPDVKIVWESSNASVANVDQSGKVTGTTDGTAVITASAGGFSAECTVTVLPIEAESVTVNKSSLTLEQGDGERLTATVGPVNATYKDISWSSSDEKVATVDASGYVIAVAPGEAVITASCGKASGSCNVTVTEQTTPRYAVGDIIEFDGKKAFVFWITDNGKHGKVMSVEMALSPDPGLWSSENVLVGATSTTDGKANTEKVLQMPNYPDAYPAFAWVEKNFGNDWYIPSQEECGEYFKALVNLNNILNPQGIFPPSYLDTSTESSAAEYVYLGRNFNGGYDIMYAGKSEGGTFAAVREF